MGQGTMPYWEWEPAGRLAALHYCQAGMGEMTMILRYKVRKHGRSGAE
jgi:hypothetical protein